MITSRLLGAAEKNGISYQCLRDRLRRGWTPERATTEPIRIKTVTEELKRKYEPIALANGICWETVKTRMYKLGMPVEEATTKPVNTQFKPTEAWTKWKETALSNGIDSCVFHNRLKRGWTPERAAYTPKMKRGRAKKNSAQKYFGIFI